MKQILVFIDDSRKIKDKDSKFVTFSAVVFLEKEEYKSFETMFKENFNKVVIKNLTYQEVKKVEWAPKIRQQIESIWNLVLSFD